MYRKKLGAVMAMCLVIVGVTALPAFAHHPTVTGNIVCDEQTGSYDVTWTVSNGNWENRTMTLDQSSRAVVPLSSYAPDESKSYPESLPGDTDGTTTLTVRGDWNNGGPQNVVGSGSVQSSGTCQADEPERKHTICHATNSTTNPYSGHEETINPSQSGVLNGHLDHTGPVPTSQAHLEQLKDDHISWGDIIPPFDYDGQTYSLNWPAGQAIFDNGCALPEPEPEPEPDLDIDKRADEDSVDAGDDIGYTVTVSNEGDGTAKDVELTDELPDDEGLDWEIAGASGGWDCEIEAGTLTCGGEGFDLDPGEDASVHIVSPTTPDTCGTVKNQAEADASNAEDDEEGEDDQQTDQEADAQDDDEGDDEDDVESEVVSIEVDCTPAIQVVKDGPDLVHRGDTITYLFGVTNTGQLDLSDVELTDPICDDGTIELVDDGDGDQVLAIDEVWRYTCTRLVTDDDPDPLPNTATVRGDADAGEGEDEVTDTDDHVVDIIHPAIDIVKSVSEEIVQVGGTVTYTYVIQNTGDTTLYDISVDDDILGHIGDIALLEPGRSATLTKDFVVGNAPVTNVAIASGEDVLGHTVSADDAVTVTPIAGATPPPPTTPFTGSDAGELGLLTVLLFGVGVTVVATTRRRRPEREAA